MLKNGAVSAGQAAASTGQAVIRGGTRTAADATLAEVSALLRQSKLPDGFAVWLEKNWDDLKRNPKLASNKTDTHSSSQSSSAATPPELKAMRERQGRDDVAETSGNQSQPVVERTNHEKVASGERSARDNTALIKENSTTKNPANAVKLSKQLASEQQLGEAGIPVAGAGTKTVLRDANRLVNEYGGNASDWAKRSSTQHTATDGRKFETHWYENSVTGQRVEPKTIVEEYLKGPK
ncbi:hypothetical protein [Methylobacter sp. BlB1]|uniref:hypothetical protein n=1 Tax=Methylobacter sp. BlB1 TaxID=2785914 RepID=UPI001E3E16DC|nr:hypothetical protein [Methylobacter sp. BlB1]